MQRVVEGLVDLVIGGHACDVIRLRLFWAVAIWILLFGLGEQLVGDAHLDVVGLAGKHRDRLVLRLPAEARDGAVVAAAVGPTGDPKGRALRSRSRLSLQNLAILN